MRVQLVHVMAVTASSMSVFDSLLAAPNALLAAMAAAAG